MPALDPFSASSRPMIAFDSLPSKPLQFGQTLQFRDPNIINTKQAENGFKPKQRQYAEPLPDIFPEPSYSHSRRSSVGSFADFAEEFKVVRMDDAEMTVGSDEWMRNCIARCLDSASTKVDLSRKGLQTLSTRISDLQNLVTISQAKSPSLAPRRPIHSPSASPNPNLSPSASPGLPGRDPFSADARPFARTVSAPATSNFFNGLNGDARAGPSTLVVQRKFSRVPSGLRSSSLLDSPAITETSEEGEGPVRMEGSIGERAVSSSPEIGSKVGSTRPFGRSKTGAVTFGKEDVQNRVLELYLGQNELKSLPTALFEITNLTVLILRNNQLTELPAAVGALRNLTELNIASNKIKYVPYTILGLEKLNNFKALPNDFWPIPPSDTRPTEQPSTPSSMILSKSPSSTLGPLIRHNTSPVSSLSAMCTNILISPRSTSGLPPLLEHYTFEQSSGSSHPLLDASRMQEHLEGVNENDVLRILQAARSACIDLTAKSSSSPFRRSTITSQTTSRDFFPRSHRDPKPDDAAKNPYFSPCPSPKHKYIDESSERKFGRMERRLYLHPAEERIEWREVAGVTGVPIRWAGCAPGCLSFLEEDEDDFDSFGMDDDDEEPQLIVSNQNPGICR